MSAISQDTGNALRGKMSANAGLMSLGLHPSPVYGLKTCHYLVIPLCLHIDILYSVQLFLTVFGRSAGLHYLICHY